MFLENADGIVVVFTFDDDVVNVADHEKVGLTFVIVQVVAGWNVDQLENNYNIKLSVQWESESQNQDSANNSNPLRYLQKLSLLELFVYEPMKK